MSCSRATEIDLVGFLEDPRGADFADFRDHYPRCRECAGEVRAWTELRLALGAGGLAAGNGPHPEPQLLLRYEDRPAALTADERSSLDEHLARCAACRDEVRALRNFAPDALAAPEAAPARTPRWLEGLRALRRIAWSPAFAYALVGLLLFPILYRNIGPVLLAPGAHPRTETAQEAAPDERRTISSTKALKSVRAEEEAPPAPASPPPAPASPPIEARRQRVSEPTTGRLAEEGRIEASERKADAARIASGEGLARLHDFQAPAETRDLLSSNALERAEGDANAAYVLLGAEPARIRLDQARRGVVLILALPEDAPRDAEVRLVLTGPEGRREPRETQILVLGDTEVLVTVPPDWLRAGDHRVELGLWTDDGEVAVARYELAVEASGAEE